MYWFVLESKYEIIVFVRGCVNILIASGWMVVWPASELSQLGPIDRRTLERISYVRLQVIWFKHLKIGR